MQLKHVPFTGDVLASNMSGPITHFHFSGLEFCGTQFGLFTDTTYLYSKIIDIIGTDNGVRIGGESCGDEKIVLSGDRYGSELWVLAHNSSGSGGEFLKRLVYNGAEKECGKCQLYVIMS